MRYLCIVLLSIGFAAGGRYLQEKEHDAEKLLILSVVHYFMNYVLVSGILFWMNRFTIKRAALLTCGLFFTYFLWAFYKADRQDRERSIKGRSEWISLFAVFAAVVFSSGHFEFYGMGQDQGVYQTEAMLLYYGEPMKGVIADEYDELTDEKYKQYYKRFISKKAGYDLLKDNTFVPGIDEDEILSEVEGNWHGIPTYAAILGLCAKIFGLPHMQVFGTVCLICLLFMMEFILASFRVKQGIRALAILLLGISPQVIWIKKSALTEGFLAVLIITYLYYMTAAPQKDRIKSCIPIVVFSFYHVTVFTMMPMFLCIYWLMYVRSKDRVYLKCAKISIAGYVTGFFMMWMVQPKYTLLNYRYGLRFLSRQQLFGVIAIVIAASIAAYIFTVILPEIRIAEKVCMSDQWIMGCAKWVCVAGIGWILVRAVMKQYTASDYQMLTLICYSVLSGFIIVPFILVRVCGQKYEVDHNKLVLLVMFAWCIVIYSVLMRRDIQYYYYYARYIMPYLALILIFFLVLETNIYRQAVCLLFGCILLFPYANKLRLNQDDSHMDWNVVMEVIENTKEGTTVLMDIDESIVDISRLLYFPLKAARNVKVYPVMNTVEETLEYIPEEYRSQYTYMTKDTRNMDDKWLKLVYKNNSVFKEDNLRNKSGWNGLVTAFPEQPYTISIYKTMNETKVIDRSINECFTSGWASLNNAGFRWMRGKTAFVECYLHADDYYMQITTGDGIPFDRLSIDSIETEVFINQTFLQKIKFSKETGTADAIWIPKEYVKDGYNEIQFKSDTWSPAEYGSSDQSVYGFSVDSIQFTSSERTFLDSRTSACFRAGWADVNESGYRWMLGDTAVAECFLKEQDYMMQLGIGDAVPFEKLEKKELAAKVYCNQKLVKTIKFTKDSNTEMRIKIPKKYVKNGRNELLFQCGTWSPAEYGDSDDSRYGFSVSYLAFIPEGTSTLYAKSKEAFSDGWSEVNESGFRWMNAPTSVIKCTLEQEDYEMELITGDTIPFDQISKHEIEVAVSVNGKYLEKMIYAKNQEPVPKKIHIPQKYLKKTDNKISFQSSLWSPAKYGSEDKSHYGISISRIEFSKEAEN